MTTINFYLPKLPNNAVEALRIFSLTLFDRPNNALAHFLEHAARSEIQRRHWNAENPSEPPVDVDLPVIEFENWSDCDVGDALLVLTGASYGEFHSMNETTGEFIDEMVVVVVLEATNRLKASGDERNATTYPIRMLQPRGNTND